MRVTYWVIVLFTEEIIVKINLPDPTLRTTALIYINWGSFVSCHSPAWHPDHILFSKQRHPRNSTCSSFLRAQASSLKCFDSCVMLRLRQSQTATRLSQMNLYKKRETRKWKVKGGHTSSLVSASYLHPLQVMTCSEYFHFLSLYISPLSQVCSLLTEWNKNTIRILTLCWF